MCTGRGLSTCAKLLKKKIGAINPQDLLTIESLKKTLPQRKVICHSIKIHKASRLRNTENLLHKNIVELLETKYFDYLKYLITINKVDYSKGKSSLMVYWKANGDPSVENEIAGTLQAISCKIRQDLIDSKCFGMVPPILFSNTEEYATTNYQTLMKLLNSQKNISDIKNDVDVLSNVDNSKSDINVFEIYEGLTNDNFAEISKRLHKITQSLYHKNNNNQIEHNIGTNKDCKTENSDYFNSEFTNDQISNQHIYGLNRPLLFSKILEWKEKQTKANHDQKSGIDTNNSSDSNTDRAQLLKDYLRKVTITETVSEKSVQRNKVVFERMRKEALKIRPF